MEMFSREATPLLPSGNAAGRTSAESAKHKHSLRDVSSAATQRKAGLTPLEVAASVAVLNVRKLRRRRTLFSSNKVVGGEHKHMGDWGSFLFLSNLARRLSARTVRRRGPF